MPIHSQTNTSKNITASAAIDCILRLEKVEGQRDSVITVAKNKQIERDMESKKKWYFGGIGLLAGLILGLLR